MHDTPQCLTSHALDLEFKMPACRRCNEWWWNDSNYRFPPIRMLFLVGTCFFYSADFFIDTFAAVEHYLAWRKGSDISSSYFIATVFFIIFPSIIINFVSLALYSWSYMVHNRHALRYSYCNNLHPTPSDNIRPLLWHRNNTITGLENKKHMSAKDDDDVIELVPVDSDQRSRFSRQKSFSKQQPRYQSSTKASDLGPLAEEVDSSDEHSEAVNEKEEIDSPTEFYPLDQLSNKQFLLIILLHILQIGFFYRVVRLFYQRKKDPYSFDRYRDISFLRLIEAFLESAPQLLLQLYIVVVEEITDPVRKGVTAVTVVVSMISLSMAIADYISSGKDIIYYDPPPNRVRKPRLSWTGYILIILWNLGMTISRGIAISLFASEYSYYVFIPGAMHYLIMLYWLYRQDTYIMKSEFADFSVVRKKKKNRICYNYGIEFLAAAFNIFFLFKLFSGDSILYSTAFYTLVFMENALMISLWYVHVDYKLELWYQEAAPVAVLMSFIIGLCLLLIYYVYFQPKDMPDLEKDPNMSHPVMTCTLNRMYRKVKD